MATYKTKEVSYNYLPNNAFKLNFNSLPNIEFLAQYVPIPEISFQEVNAESRRNIVPYPGTILNYEPLEVEFILDEDLKSYIEMYTWVKKLSAEQPSGFELSPTDSFCTIESLTSKSNSNLVFEFQNIVPIRLGSINFNILEGDTQYLTCTVDFAYEKFTIKQLGF